MYARNLARSVIGKPNTPINTFLLTYTTDGNITNFFAHYSMESQGRVEYHQWLTAESFLRSSLEAFEKTQNQIGNAQDFAKEASEKLRDELNEKFCKRARDGRKDGEDEDKSPVKIRTRESSPPNKKPCLK